MSQEIERAYRVNEALLPELGTVPAKRIDQVYFSPYPPSEAYPEVASGEWRVRTVTDDDGSKSYKATVKFGDKASGSRTEIETGLDRGDFGTSEADVSEFGFGIISKTRYDLGDDLTIDQFHEPATFEWLAEKEFASEQAVADWQPPEWCVPAVNIPGNRALARPLAAQIELFHRRRQLGIRAIQAKQREHGHTIVTVSGMSGSGKSTLAREIADWFNASYIEADHYHIGTANLAARHNAINHDLPAAYDYEHVARDIAQLVRGKSVFMPRYDFVSGERVDGEGERVEPSLSNVIVVEGLYAKHVGQHLKNAEAHPIVTHDILVDTPLYVCVLRRMMRDALQQSTDGVAQRKVGMTPEETLRYLHQVAIPTYQQYAHHPESFDAIV